MVCVLMTGEKWTLTVGGNGTLAAGETDSQHSTGVTVCGVSLTHLQWDSGHLSAIARPANSLVCLCLPLKMMTCTSTLPNDSMCTCN